MPPFSPPNRGQASLGSLLQPCSFHPHKFSLSPDSQCVSAHIHHQLQGGIPVFGSLTPGAALIVHGAFFRTDSPKLASPQPQSPPGSLRTDAKQLPTNRRLTETVLCERAPAGKRPCSTNVPAARFPVLPLKQGLSFREQAQNLGFRGGGLSKRATVLKASFPYFF